jgi:sodium-dependent dicarboxylate transporter 2/3/5
MVVALPVVALALLFLWRFLLLIHPPGDITIGSDTSVTEKIKGRDYVVIAIFVATCIGWLTSDLHGQPTGVVSLLPIIALFGFRLLNTNDFRSLSWDVLFMIGGGLSLGLGLQESGLTSVVVDLAPKEAAFYIVILTFGFIGAVMSSFISNTATANLLVPLAISFSEHTTILVVTLAMVCSSAMVLPVSTPPNAIAFGSGVVRGSDMMKAGVVVSLVTFAIIYAASKFYWNALELI